MISAILESISGAVLNIISASGYVGVFILSALESAAIPIPSEIVVPFSGFLAVSGRFSFWGVVMVTTVANLVGSLALFFISRSGGRWLIERYGRYVFVGKEDLDMGEKWFKDHGTKAVFWGRILPGIRTFISLGAGVANMDLWRFVVFTFLGALPWNFALALVGYKAGKNWNILHQYFQKFDILIVVVIIVAIVWYVWHKNKNRS